MFDLNIDLTALAEPLPEEVVQRIIEDLADGARDQWIKLAGEEFKTTRRDYINGIQPVEKRPGVCVLTLTGALPMMLENGAPQMDLRNTLLGPNVPVAPKGQPGKRKGKNGYYRAIPFRHSVPDSEGTTAPRMGSAYGNHAAVRDAKELGAVVYGKAKKLKGTVSDPTTGKVKYGGRLKEGLAPKLKPHHVTDIYAGMIKERKTYEKATQSQYTTFRTISTAKKIGWIRPATPGAHLAQKVEVYLDKIAPMAFEAYVAEVTKP